MSDEKQSYKETELRAFILGALGLIVAVVIGFFICLVALFLLFGGD